METCEIGSYILLLCAAWLSERHGFLPDSDEKLRRLAKMTPEQWVASRDAILSKFPVVEEGWRANPRMVEEANKQERFSEVQREKINKRWDSVRARNESGNTGVSDSDTGVIPSVSVSASASASASDTVSGSANTLALTASAVPAEVPLIVLPLVKGEHRVTKAEVNLWANAYPAVDVMAELRKLLAWLDANPSRRSAKVGGSKKRITNWLSNAQDRGGRNGGNRGNGAFGHPAGANGKTGGNLDAGSRVLAAISHRQGVAHAG